MNKRKKLEKSKSLPKVLVMMATYNGEKYVAQQIESILQQEKVEVYLQISDDGSSDKTPEICKSYSSCYSNVSFSVNKKNEGVANNFMNMAYAAPTEQFDYFAFSDQDDYWLPNKLYEAVRCLKLDSEYNMPALYYSDVLNVDEKLRNPEPEYYTFSALSNSLKTLLICNYASGCTMVFNWQLNDLLKKHPVQYFPRIHDSWVHLVAMTCGKTYSDLGRSFIYRRITDNNQVGKRELGSLAFKRIISLIRGLKIESKNELTETALILLKSFSDELNKSDFSILQQFTQQRKSIVGRFKVAMDRNYRLPSRSETIIVKLRILLGRA